MSVGSGPLSPVVAAGAVLEELRAALPGWRSWQEALEALDRTAADPRMAEGEARRELEARVAELLAGGWRPGHEHLLVAASERFGWLQDRPRLLQLGGAGAVVGQAIDDELSFVALGPGERSLYHEVVSRLRLQGRPPDAELTRLLPILERLRVRSPTWLRLLAPAEAVGRWYDGAWRRGPAPLAPPRRARSALLWVGAPLAAVFIVLMVLLAAVGSSRSPRVSPARPKVVRTKSPSEILEGACRQGDPGSCVLLGSQVLHGEDGLAKDPGRAAGLFRLACETPSSHPAVADGCRRLGYLLDGWKGDPSVVTQAAVLFQKVCDQRVWAACFSAAVLHEKGHGVKKDLKRARELYRLACDQGLAGACYRLATLELTHGSGDAGTREAAEHYRKACDLGDAYGCGMLGTLLRLGVGVKTDRKQAAVMFQKACDGGDAPACSSLAASYDGGTGVPRDRDRATELYEKGCRGGDAKACQALEKRRPRAAKASGD